jgi:hypothetical protein
VESSRPIKFFEDPSRRRQITPQSVGHYPLSFGLPREAPRRVASGPQRTRGGRGGHFRGPPGTPQKAPFWTPPEPPFSTPPPGRGVKIDQKWPILGHLGKYPQNPPKPWGVTYRSGGRVWNPVPVPGSLQEFSQSVALPGGAQKGPKKASF